MPQGAVALGSGHCVAQLLGQQLAGFMASLFAAAHKQADAETDQVLRCTDHDR